MKILWYNPETDEVSTYKRGECSPYKFLFWETEEGGLIISSPKYTNSSEDKLIEHFHLWYIFNERKLIPDKNPDYGGICIPSRRPEDGYRVYQWFSKSFNTTLPSKNKQSEILERFP